MRQATVSINQDALQYNLNRVKQLAPKSKIVSMVKADAYGHGLENSLSALAQTDAFGVACLSEALEIRQLGFEQLVTLIEGVFSEDEMQIAIDQRFECMVHHQQQVEWLIQHKVAYQAKKLKVWIKLNSGMNRLGFKADEIIDVINNLKAEGFECVLAMHFANADSDDHPLNEQQKQLFLQVREACMPILCSCCNSAAILKWPELHFDYVRPGVMLYGASPFADRSVHELDLKPVMTFSAEVIAINHIQAGEKVGYGSLVTAEKEMDIAVVSIGYGDGYPRAYIAQNSVVVNQKNLNLFGRVSMDMLTIDATGHALKIGDSVELWGEQRLVDDVAKTSGTIGYELLCRLSNRPTRKIKA
ncbi:alanine racemase [Acinetobacter sp. MD2(2019)]|uniref:alanine racemase n=1 Tax=Acinetobacter sp. MD2(2019) TaxID=2605273 RepID=UPI002D1F2E52|nr:alanine racemase [Acinetobacter sp. MD2(2019)]MEB3752925.1 alanine racemase [Acinetobacter sp. MD2(2019)]